MAYLNLEEYGLSVSIRVSYGSIRDLGAKAVLGRLNGNVTKILPPMYFLLGECLVHV